MGSFRVSDYWSAWYYAIVTDDERILLTKKKKYVKEEKCNNGSYYCYYPNAFKPFGLKHDSRVNLTKMSFQDFDVMVQCIREILVCCGYPPNIDIKKIANAYDNCNDCQVFSFRDLYSKPLAVTYDISKTKTLLDENPY